MTSIVASPLEVALELSLESIGFPLSAREYFFQAAMRYYLNARDWEWRVKKERGKEFYDRITKPKNPERLTPEERIIEMISTEKLFLPRTPLPLIERYSSVNPRGLRVIYRVFANDKEEALFGTLKYEDYIPFVNDLIKSGNHMGELIGIQEHDTVNNILGASKVTIVKDKIISVDESADGDNSLYERFREFQGKDSNTIGPLVRRICEVIGA